MSHLDEGQLAALLDGELEPETKRTVEAHLAACAECRALWDEIRDFAGEADRLVASVELPPRQSLTASPAVTAAPKGSSPDMARRPLPLRTLAWAATVVLAVGLGYSLRSVSRTEAPAAMIPATAADKQLADREEKGAEPSASAAPTTPPTARNDLAQQGDSRETNPKLSAPPASKPIQDGAGAVPGLATGNASAGHPPAARNATAPVASPQGTLQPTDAHVKRAVPERTARESISELTLSRARDGFQAVDLESAVRIQGGSIRLVDGLNPERVLSGPGRLLPGGDPTLEIVRVVYLDPPGRELWLDQQRARPSTEAERDQRRSTLLPGDTILAPAAEGGTSIRWLDQHGFLLSLTGFLPEDSLRAIIPRVH
jgi:anti-sigma factor RsiW